MVSHKEKIVELLENIAYEMHRSQKAIQSYVEGVDRSALDANELLEYNLTESALEKIQEGLRDFLHAKAPKKSASIVGFNPSTKRFTLDGVELTCSSKFELFIDGEWFVVGLAHDNDMYYVPQLGIGKSIEGMQARRSESFYTLQSLF